MNLLKMNTATSNWLAALQACIADGGTLAKPETAAENTEIQTILGEEIDSTLQAPPKHLKGTPTTSQAKE